MSDEKYGHIHPEFRHIACLSMEERLNFLDQPRWIGYSAAHQILDTLQGLMRKPKQPRMPNLLIVGDSNQGKTTLIRRFYELCGTPYINDEADPIKPVIVAEASSTADEKRLYCSILERFHAPYRATDPTTKLLYQVIHLIQRCLGHCFLLKMNLYLKTIFQDFHTDINTQTAGIQHMPLLVQQHSSLASLNI